MRISASIFAIAALTAGAALAQVPEIRFDSTQDLLKLPEDIYLGAVGGVATNSKGRIFVYTRTGDSCATTGTSRTFTHGGSRLFEFDPNGRFVREIGRGFYGFLEAQAVRVDARDNIWIVDRRSNLAIEFDPEGHMLMALGRKPEAISVGGSGREGSGAGNRGDVFDGPTDVAWDARGNIFVADGYGNARVAKFDKDGRFLKSWGSRGAENGQFNNPRSLAIDAQGNVYVADRGNRRIQVFDNEGNFKSRITGVGAPAAICISPGSRQFLYTSNSNELDSMDGGEIYRLDLDGKILGKFGRAGHRSKEFGSVNEIDCRRADELYVAEPMNWRVQKLTLH
ncbi:MAG: peptidyl-alpha-hydroxyglycine alpha-amidating lyase family protein [Bryobacteraceae bacterium]